MTYYYPKRPIKSFQDLEVYQKALAVSVAVVKRITSDSSTSKHLEGGRMDSFQVEGIVTRLHQVVLSLPILIATAHSLRFSDPQKAIENLEETMLNCNLAIVYLEEYRDIINKDIETEFFEEQIKTLLSSRMRIMHLQMSWKKFNKITEGRNV